MVAGHCIAPAAFTQGAHATVHVSAVRHDNAFEPVAERAHGARLGPIDEEVSAWP